MKTIKLISFFATFFSIFFGFSQPKVISQFYDELTSNQVYLMTTSKTGIYSFSLLKNGNYEPYALYSESNNKYTVYDINEKEILEGDLEKTIEEIEKNGVLKKDDLEQGRAAGCLGGSTLGCIRVAFAACADDYDCSLLCRSVGWRCPAAIALSCAIHCNT